MYTHPKCVFLCKVLYWGQVFFLLWLVVFAAAVSILSFF
jgi:hypothetical protein